MTSADPDHGPTTAGRGQRLRSRRPLRVCTLLLALATAGCAGVPAAAPTQSATAPTRSAPAPTRSATSSSPAGSSAPSATTGGPAASSPAVSDPAVATRSVAPSASDPDHSSAAPIPSISGIPTAGSTTGGVATGLHTLVHDHRTRVWVQYTPPQGTAGRPLVVFLSGTDSTVKFETARDRLLPLVAAGDFTLVYPVAFEESWNAGDGCCEAAAEAQLDDVDFVRTVTDRAIALDRPDASRVYLAGYSAGGKIAWNLVCTDPGVFAAVATYGANPEKPCATGGQSLSVFIGFGSKDRAEPLAGEKTDSRGTHPPSLDNVRAWLTRDGCPAASVTQKTVDVTTQSWRCAGGTTVAYALWPAERHIWPQPPSTSLADSAGLQMWSFLEARRRGP